MYLHFIRPLNISQSNVGEVFLYSNFHHYTLPSYVLLLSFKKNFNAS